MGILGVQGGGSEGVGEGGGVRGEWGGFARVRGSAKKGCLYTPDCMLHWAIGALGKHYSVHEYCIM